MQQRGLAHAGFADDRQVPPPVVGADAEFLAGGTEFHTAKYGNGGIGLRGRQSQRRFPLAAFGDLHGRRADGRGGRMPEGGEFLAGEQRTGNTPERSGACGCGAEGGRGGQRELAEGSGQTAQLVAGSVAESGDLCHFLHPPWPETCGRGMIRWDEIRFVCWKGEGGL